MAYVDIWSEILGHVPRLDALLAQKLVNRAWQETRDSRQWSWLRGFGVLFAPQLISTGTVSVTQFSATVTLDSASGPALGGLSNPVISLRQIRVSQGPLYNITAYTPGSPATLTLDRPYMEGSATGQVYSVYRCYYTPTDNSGNPVTDFKIFRAILNPIDGYAIVGPNLRLTRAELDARDPTRGAADLAYTVASFNVDSNGNPIYELWPHPTYQRAYLTLYLKRGLDLSATNALPNTISANMIVEGALRYAYDWAIANAGRFPELKGTNWALLKAETERRYQRMYQQARIVDDDIMTDSFIPGLRDYLAQPPIDAKFWQSHDISSWFANGYG